MIEFPPELEHGSGIMMALDPSRLLLSYAKDQTAEKVASLVSGASLVLEDADEKKGDYPELLRETVNHTERRFWVRSRNGAPISKGAVEELERAAGPDLEWVAPVYRLGQRNTRGAHVTPLPNVLIVEPRPNAGRAFAARLRRLGLEEVQEKSQHLAGFRYYLIPDLKVGNAYQVREVLLKEDRELVAAVHFENMPMIVPLTVVPSDPFFPQQWNMTQIAAGGAGTTGWDISTGTPAVIVCVLDSGVDQTHPDLQLAGPGINLGTMMPPGSPVGPPGVIGHGTCCAGIVAGLYNNGVGVAGVAGSCSILPVAFQNWTDVEVAAGINWATANGANVISMSFGVYLPGEVMGGPTGWNFAVINPAIANAVTAGLVLCAATGNENVGTFNRYPARNPLVIACGASDQSDNRKSPTSPDGECWGSNFAPGVSVVAPGVQAPTTDMQGAGGYNASGGSIVLPCVTYPSAGDAAGNYLSVFNGTSCATPHVSGLAALLRSAYSSLTNAQIRSIIEHTADKVGAVPYADAPGFPNGTRNQQMGYGRIDVYKSLDFGDVYIKDWSSDNGVEPSTPPGGDFWDFSDIVVRPTDDGVFVPSDVTQASNVERGQDNTIYVRVTNNGPETARNVTIDVRITPWVGLEFVYPADWTTVDPAHVSPASVASSFATIASGGTATAKFTVSSAQVDTLWGWVSGMGWHPCLLARVQADNDYAFATAAPGSGLQVKRNNLAQRNLSVVDVVATASVTFPVLAGNEASDDRLLDIVVDRSLLPETMELLLSLDDDGHAFPLVDVWPRRELMDEGDETELVFLERTRIKTTFGGCRGLLVLERGSRFNCEVERAVRKVSVVEGGEIVLRDGRRFVEVRGPTAVVHIERHPRRFCPLSLHSEIPANAEKGNTYPIGISQRNMRGETVGGARVVYMVR